MKTFWIYKKLKHFENIFKLKKIKQIQKFYVPSQGSYPDVLEPAPNSVVCTSLGTSKKEWKASHAERDLSDFPADGQQPSHMRQVSVSEIFHVEEKEDRFIRAMSRECKQASADCEMCLEKQNCSGWCRSCA